MCSDLLIRGVPLAVVTAIAYSECMEKKYDTARTEKKRKITEQTKEASSEVNLKTAIELS